MSVLAAPMDAPAAGPRTRTWKPSIHALATEAGVSWAVARTLLFDHGIAFLPGRRWVVRPEELERARSVLRRHAELLSSLGFAG